MKPVLVTGATGFVGWHVARQLLERGRAGAGVGAGSGAQRKGAGGVGRNRDGSG